MRPASQISYQSLEILGDADVNRFFLRKLTLKARDSVCDAGADRLERFLFRRLK